MGKPPVGAMSSPWGESNTISDLCEEIPAKYCGLAPSEARRLMAIDKQKAEDAKVARLVEERLATKLEEQCVEFSPMEFADLNNKLVNAGFQIDPTSTMKRIVYRFGDNKYCLTKSKV